MLGITFLSSIPPTQRLVFLSPVCCLPNARDHVSIKHPTHPTTCVLISSLPPSYARDHVSIKHPTHPTTCGHISSLPPTQLSGSGHLRACHPFKFFLSHCKLAADPMLRITLLLSMPSLQIHVVISSASCLPNARFFLAYHIYKFLWSHSQLAAYYWKIYLIQLKISMLIINQRNTYFFLCDVIWEQWTHS